MTALAIDHHTLNHVARAIFIGDYPKDSEAPIVWDFAATNLPDSSIVTDYHRRAHNAITAYTQQVPQ